MKINKIKIYENAVGFFRYDFSAAAHTHINGSWMSVVQPVHLNIASRTDHIIK